MKTHLRYALPVVMTIATMLFIYCGRQEDAEYMRRLNSAGNGWNMPSWEAMPVSSQLLGGLNFPAVVISSQLYGLLGGSPYVWQILGTVVCWWIVGAIVDGVLIPKSGNGRIGISVAILLIGSGFAAAVVLTGRHFWILYIGELLWCMVAILYSGRFLYREWKYRRVS